jgi:hypothetical protein
MAFAITFASWLSPVRADDAAREDPRSLIPWRALDETTREKLEGVVDDATVYHRTAAEVFICSEELYQLYLYDPVLTLELWKGLAESDATLEAVGAGQFRGTDGQHSKGQWEFAYKSPTLNVIFADGQYRGPLFGTTLHTKSVLVLRTVCFQEADGRRYVKHQLDGWVKAESGTLRPLAKAVRSLFAKSVEATMQESLWFVSLMCRYTLHDPHAIARAIEQNETIAAASKQQLQKLLVPLCAVTPERKPIARRAKGE